MDRGSWRTIVHGVTKSQTWLKQLSIHSGMAIHTRWPKYWSFSFNISPSNEYSGLISFRVDWFDLLAVQGTLKSLLQHHNLKASILWCSAFSMVQLSHPYMTTGKTTALTVWTFVSKVMSLLFNTLSRSKRLLIPLLSSPTVHSDFETSHCFHVFACYLPLMYC